MKRFQIAVLTTGLALPLAPPVVAADTVMVQCGQQYQAAKSAGTLNGMTWNQYRTDCATRLKAQPASAAAPASAAPAPPVAATPAPPVAAAVAAAPAASAAASPKTTAPTTGGRAAMLDRQKACGAEWRAQKATLVAQTPGLTWPKYWSQCNTRMKAGLH